LLYRDVVRGDEERRFGADFYLAGSMIAFLFTGVRAMEMVISELDPQFHPDRWEGTYVEVLPYLQRAFSKNLAALQGNFHDARLRDELCDVYKQMCNPDIVARGDRFHRSAIGSRFGLERFISKFDMLRSLALAGKVKHQ